MSLRQELYPVAPKTLDDLNPQAKVILKHWEKFRPNLVKNLTEQDGLVESLAITEAELLSLHQAYLHHLPSHEAMSVAMEEVVYLPDVRREQSSVRPRSKRATVNPRLGQGRNSKRPLDGVPVAYGKDVDDDINDLMLAAPPPPDSLWKVYLASLLGFSVCVVVTLVVCFNYGSTPTKDTPYFIDDNDVYYSPPLLANDPRTFAAALYATDAVRDGYTALDEKVELATDYERLVYVNPKTMKSVVKGDPRGHILVASVSREELQLDHLNRKPDRRHVNQDGFQDNCNILIWVLRKCGFTEPRFAPDGSWNW